MPFMGKKQCGLTADTVAGGNNQGGNTGRRVKKINFERDIFYLLI